MPVTPNTPFIPNAPVILSTNFTIPPNSGVPFYWASPFTLIQKDVTIFVKNGAEMASINAFTTTFEGCKGMWKGIQLESNGKLQMKNAIVKDAYSAVNMTPTAGSVAVHKTVFENNDVGIRINGPLNTTPDLSGLTFIQTAPLEKAATAQDPFPVQRALAGIRAVSGPPLTVQHDEMLEFSATFKNLQHGIYADNTPVSIASATFSNMFTESSGAGTGIRVSNGDAHIHHCAFGQCRVGIRAYKGIIMADDNFLMETDSAISTHASLLTAHRNTIEKVKTGIGGRLGSVLLNKNNIHNAEKGIGFLGAQLIVENNTLTMVNTGIKTTLCSNQKIRNNTIQAIDYGIAFYQQNANYGTSEVENNAITMKGNDNGVGISCAGSALFPHYGGTLLNNTISLLQGQAGIHTLSARAMDILYNHIVLSHEQPADGIRMEDNDLMTVSDNDVTGPSLLYGVYQRGVYGMHTCRTLYSCNYTEKINYGFNFVGECSGKKAVQFKGNTMYKHENGLLLGLLPNNGNAIIGAQKHHQNRWVGSFNGAGARHIGDQFIVQQSLFTADDQANDEYIPEVVDPTVWFENQPQGTDQTVACAFRPGEDDIAQDIRIATGSVQGSGDGGALLWLARRRLYERIAEEGDTLPAALHGANPEWFVQGGVKTEDGTVKTDQLSPEVAAFMQEAATSETGTFATLQMQLRQLNTTEHHDRQKLSEMDSSLLVRIAKLSALSAAVAQPDIASETEQQLSEAIRTVQAEVLALSDERAALLQATAGQRNSMAVALLGALPAADVAAPVFQANELTLYRISLELAAAQPDILSPVQQADLEAVALQCPVNGGDAVLRARALLQQYSDTPLVYTDAVICNVAGRPGEERNTVTSSTIDRVVLTPNPAHDYVTVTCPVAATTNYTITLNNAAGSVVRKAVLPAGRTSWQLSVADLPGGWYFYHIPGLRSGKLTILH